MTQRTKTFAVVLLFLAAALPASLLFTGQAQLNVANGLITGTKTSYGMLYVTGGTTSIDMPTAGTFVKMTTFTTAGPSNDCTVDAGNDKITVTRAGLYNVMLTMSYSGTANSQMTNQVYINGSLATGGQIVRKLGTGGDVGRVTCTFLAQISANQDVEVYSSGDTNGDDITLTDGNLVVIRLGD